jgi:hypothetical protein
MKLMSNVNPPDIREPLEGIARVRENDTIQEIQPSGKPLFQYAPNQRATV